MNFITKHILEITALGYLFLFVCWLFGYFCNGLFSTKFEINSVWTGIGALSGSSFIAAVKYITDSCKNSKLGEMPNIEKGGD